MANIILASASPRRKELLEKAGVSFTVCPASGEERVTKTEPEEIVEELSLAKAMAVAGDQEDGTVIIGADTIVAYGNEILGKPKDDDDAFQTLKKLQGKTHQVYTGVTILVRKGGTWQPLTFAEKTEVTFYPVSDEEILSYVRSKEPADKAGSYGIQGPFGVHVKGIRGDYSNVMGLPVPRLFQEAKKAGICLTGGEIKGWKGGEGYDQSVRV